MIKIFRLSINDFLSKKFLILSFLPFIISVIVFGGFMIFGGNELFDSLSQGAKIGDFSFLDEEKFPYTAKILSFTITKWIISALFYVAATFVVLMLSVFTALLIAGFLTPLVTKEINKRYYNVTKQNEVSALKVIKIMSIEILKFTAILFICLPLLFVPIINLFIINVPFFYIYYKFLLVDVASNVLDDRRFDFAYKKGGGYGFVFACFLFYLICLIPFAGLILQLFFVIYLTHLLYSKNASTL